MLTVHHARQSRARESNQEAHRAPRAVIKSSREQLDKECASFPATASLHEVFTRFRRSSASPEEPAPTLVVGDEVLRSKLDQTKAFCTFFSFAYEKKAEDRFDNEFKNKVDSFVEDFNFQHELCMFKGPSSSISLRDVEEAISNVGSHKSGTRQRFTRCY